MRKYRKKPVVIEAVQWHGDLKGAGEITAWIGEGGGTAHFFSGAAPALIIKTLEGDMHAMEGDWIIRGVKGEFYPCKPDIFAATYEPDHEQNWRENMGTSA